MQFCTRIFILYICILFAGCSLLPNKMKSAEEIMEKSPDSALHLLQQIKTSHKFSDADRALYGLLLFEALDKSYKTLQPDSVLNFSINYYDSKNDKARLAKCFFYKGRMYNYAQRYDEATEHYLKALDYCQGKKNYSLMGKILFDMGDICVLQGEYEEARKKFEKSILFFNLDKQFVLASYRLLDIGKTYYYSKEYSKAHQIYHKAISRTKDSTLLGALYQEIGNNFLASKKMDSAEFYLRKSLKYPIDTVGLGIRNFNFAEIFYATNKFDSSYLYARKSLDYPTNIYAKRECYRLLANTAYNIGDMKLVGEYMKNFQSCTDSVRKIESQTKTTIIEDIHNSSQIAHKNKNTIIVLFGLIPIILAIGFAIFYKLRKRNKGKEELLIQVEKKLTEKQSTLRDNLISKIEESKAHHSPEYRKSNISKRELMDREAYNNCLHINDWKLFQDIMNRTFNNIVSFLETTYPELTHKDIIWCCLYLLNTHSTDMAIVLECKPESLYKLKQRLTKKLGFKTTIELNQLLQEKSIGK